MGRKSVAGDPRDARPGLVIHRLSSVFETAPVETLPQPAFLNMVAEMSSHALPPPEQMLARLLRVEYSVGPHARNSYGTADN